ncbi:MAG: hypothetical protein M1320_02415 [Patescibacteria group bacterium]|nr:hypothetical protein [Patescibacteria group bacterium]
MKTSFNFEKYRKDLSDELRKERDVGDHEKAEKKLKEEKNTARYKISKELKLLSSKLEDAEYSQLEVKEYNISEEIPEDIKLYIDKERIKSFETSRKTNIINNNSELNFDEKQLTKLIDKLSDGSFTDKNKLNTTIYGFGGGGEELPQGGYITNLSKKLQKETLDLQDPTKRLVYGEISYYGETRVYFAAGKNPFYSPEKILVIADPTKKRFLKCLKRLHFEENGANRLDKEIEKAREHPTTGGIIIFKEGTSWLDIADYIIDLPNNKLFKLKDAEKTIQKS